MGFCQGYPSFREPISNEKKQRQKPISENRLNEILNPERGGGFKTKSSSVYHDFCRETGRFTNIAKARRYIK